MKITFLGTAAGMPRADRFNSAALIEVGEASYLIDAGAPVVNVLLGMGKRPDEIKAVFTTHHHSDHAVGLVHLISVCHWRYKETSLDVYMTTQRLADAIVACATAMDDAIVFQPERLRMHVAAPGVVWDDGTLRVTYIPTRHCEPTPSYALLLEAEGKRVVFSGDLSYRLRKEDMPVLALQEDIDLFVCEMAHFFVDDLRPYLQRCRAKQVLLNHCSSKRREDIDILLAEKESYPFSFNEVRDGDVYQV